MHVIIRLVSGILLLGCAGFAQAALVAYPNQLAFLDPVGTTSEPEYVELTNTGNATLTVVTVTPASGRFANAGGTCGTVPFTLAAQASCTLGYTSSPQAVGTIYQYLRATSADGQFDDFTWPARAICGLEVEPCRDKSASCPHFRSARAVRSTLPRCTTAGGFACKC